MVVGEVRSAIEIEEGGWCLMFADAKVMGVVRAIHRLPHWCVLRNASRQSYYSLILQCCQKEDSKLIDFSADSRVIMMLICQLFTFVMRDH